MQFAPLSFFKPVPGVGTIIVPETNCLVSEIFPKENTPLFSEEAYLALFHDCLGRCVTADPQYIIQRKVVIPREVGMPEVESFDANVIMNLEYSKLLFPDRDYILARIKHFAQKGLMKENAVVFVGGIIVAGESKFVALSLRKKYYNVTFHAGHISVRGHEFFF